MTSSEISDDRLEYLIDSLSRGRDGRANVSDDMKAASVALTELRDRRAAGGEAVACACVRDIPNPLCAHCGGTGLHPSNSGVAVKALEPDEVAFLRTYVDGQFLTYAAHNAGAGLFPAEKTRMAWLDTLSQKLSALHTSPDTGKSQEERTVYVAVDHTGCVHSCEDQERIIEIAQANLRSMKADLAQPVQEMHELEDADLLVKIARIIARNVDEERLYNAPGFQRAAQEVIQALKGDQDGE